MDLHLHTGLFTVKFADDSTFIGSGKSKDEVVTLVNNEWKRIWKWFDNNRLVLHPGNSRFLVHSKDKLIKVKLNGVNVPRSGNCLQEESVKS